MGIKERQQVILDYLEDKGVASYKELERLLEVSNMTVRRYIDQLVTTGAVIKTLGGVQKANAPANYYESSMQSRMARHQVQKHAIAQKALEHIEPANSIYLDGSTTCLEMAKLLAKNSKQLTVVTNSLLVGHELGQNKNNAIIIIGGNLDPDTYCCTGSNTEKHATEFFVDKAFISTKGFLPAEGTYESSIGMFRIKQAVATHSGEVVLLVDDSKFGQRALCKVFDIPQIDTVITNSIEKATCESLEKAGVKVLVAQKQSYKSKV